MLRNARAERDMFAEMYYDPSPRRRRNSEVTRLTTSYNPNPGIDLPLERSARTTRARGAATRYECDLPELEGGHSPTQTVGQKLKQGTRKLMRFKPKKQHQEE